MGFFDHTRKIYNPPAPKVPRRDSLGVEATDRSVRLVQLQLGEGATFDRADRQKVHRTLVICPHFADRRIRGSPGPSWI